MQVDDQCRRGAVDGASVLPIAPFRMRSYFTEDHFTPLKMILVGRDQFDHELLYRNVTPRKGPKGPGVTFLMPWA